MTSPSPRRLRRILTFAAIIWLLVTQYLLVRVPSIEPHDFDRWAVELTRSATSRYGYVVQYHGAALVHTALTRAAPPFRPPPSDAVSAAMARRLRTAPWLAGVELIFYASIFAAARYGLARLPAATPTPRNRMLVRVLGSAVMVTAALTPYVLLGYGEPLFSTYGGPGALS